METKHTPGPWLIKDMNASSGEIQIIAPDGDQEPWNVAMTFGMPNEETHSANARLIAAAPELLEALRAILASEYASGWVKEVAQDAIATATGN